MKNLRFAILFLGGLFFGVSAYTFHYAKGTSYLSSDPKACVNCHIMNDQFDSWEKSSHHAVAGCADCHLPRRGLGKWKAKMDNGWHHSVAFTLQNFHEPIMITPKNSKILEANCRDCHASITGQISAHSSLGKRDNLNCVRCHGQVGHNAAFE